MLFLRRRGRGDRHKLDKKNSTDLFITSLQFSILDPKPQRRTAHSTRNTNVPTRLNDPHIPQTKQSPVFSLNYLEWNDELFQPPFSKRDESRRNRRQLFVSSFFFWWNAGLNLSLPTLITATKSVFSVDFLILKAELRDIWWVILVCHSLQDAFLHWQKIKWPAIATIINKTILLFWSALSATLVRLGLVRMRWIGLS